jgi:tetratricopeptide (TPR) repeat protein
MFRWQFLGPAMAVVAISSAAVAARRRFPGFLTAWAAYLVILAPSLGFVRTGGFLAADRYAYLASIPLATVTAWGIAQFLQGSRHRRGLQRATAMATAVVLIGLGARTWAQTQTWRSSTLLWTNALAVSNNDNLAIMRSLAASLIDEGKTEPGIAMLRQVLEKDPDAPMVHYNLGVYEVLEGRWGQAEGHFTQAIRGLDPRSPYLSDAHFNLGTVHERLGRLDKALAEYQVATQLDPSDPEAQNNLGSVLLQLGRYADAESRFAEALRLRPDYTLAQRALDHIRRLKALSNPSDSGATRTESR